MRRILDAIKRRRRRLREVEVVAPRPALGATDVLARGLAEAIDDEQWPVARRLVAAAERVDDPPPALVAALARFDLATGATERAIARLDDVAERAPECRLLRAIAWTVAGALDEAYRDLDQWCRSPRAPAAARRLLAHLAWELDFEGRAIDALRDAPDPDALALLTTLAVARSRRAPARCWAERRAHQTGHAGDAVERVRLASLGLPAPSVAAHDLDARALARELLAAEGVIPALVTALERRPNLVDADHLASAIERALPRLRDEHEAIVALARLATVRRRPDEGSAWIRLGLERHPRSAALRLLANATATPAAPGRTAA